jgi:hypothetical protein
VRKFEHLQGVHRVKFDAISNLLGSSLFTCIAKDVATNIDTDQELHGGVGLRRFNQPIAGAATYIEHPLKESGVWLLWENPPHPIRDHLVLDLQTDHLGLIGAILHEIGAGLLSLRIYRLRHVCALLARNVL